MAVGGLAKTVAFGLTRNLDVRNYGVVKANSAAANATALQSLIDTNTTAGAVLWFCDPISCDPITLKSNIHLRGNNLAAFKGSTPDGGATPALSATPSGSAFLITNTSTAFCTMQSNTSMDGFVLHYPNQVFTATTIAGTTTYPATFVKASGKVEGIGLSRLCFVGATHCMQFIGDATNFIADMAIDLCYGYPLGGNFLRIDFALDIPRVTRCHVNPGSGYQFLGDANGWATVPIKQVLHDDVVANGGDVFYFASTDELVVMQCFVYGQKVGFRFVDCYGTVSQCNCDIVQTGFWPQITSNNKYIAFIGCNVINSNIGTQANRNAFVYDGSAGNIKLSACHSFPAVSANAFLKVNGSSAQRAFISADCTYTGTFTTGVDQTNGSSVITGSPVHY